MKRIARRPRYCLIFLLSALMPGVLLAASGDAENIAAQIKRGKQLAQACAACHGADGNTANAELYPNLAAQGAEYIVLQLENFKSGERPNAQMKAISSGLQESEMADMGVYFNSRKAKPQPASDRALQSEGRKVFKGGSADGAAACASCHGNRGEGNSGFPRIASQPAKYTLDQLHVYRDAPSFKNPLANQMKAVAVKVSEKEMRAVSAFLASQP